MIHIKKYLLYIALILLSGWTLFYLWWNSTGKTIHESTWTCTGEGRHQSCEIKNFCVDKNNGPFIIHSHDTPPKINMINADESIWFQPKRVRHSVNAIHINETVFVYGLYSPFHFSHFLYNGLMPLYSTMMDHKASSWAWTMRVATHWNKHTPIDLVLPSSQDIVLESKDVLTTKQVKPGYKPMCFSKAVVGTGNRCSLWHCDNQIPSTHYASYKKYVLDQPVEPNNTCLTSIITYKETGKYRVGILNRKNTRHITNISELIDRLQKEQDFSIVSIDFDQQGCDIIHTAQAVKDLDILIAPFGNGLGAGLFMKDDAILISISARWYNEDWFKYPMTAIGRRTFNFECRNASCQEYDPVLASSILKEYRVTLNETEMQSFVSEKYPEHVMSRYLPGKEWHPIYQYQKDVSRRVDVVRFIPYLRMILANKPPNNMSYPETCKKENVCCDTDCGGPLGRNIFGENNAWKK